MKVHSISASDLKRDFSNCLSMTQYGGDRFIVERNGKPSAVLISMDELSQLDALIAMAREGKLGAEAQRLVEAIP